MTKTNKQLGFSLLEVLIAFSIMALSLGILLKIFSAGVNNAALAEEYNYAVQIAQSILASSGTETTLQANENTGITDEKYHWRVTITPFLPRSMNVDTETIPVNLFKIHVMVSWGDDSEENDRSVELTTLKLVSKI